MLDWLLFVVDVDSFLFVVDVDSLSFMVDVESLLFVVDVVLSIFGRSAISSTSVSSVQSIAGCCSPALRAVLHIMQKWLVIF